MTHDKTETSVFDVIAYIKPLATANFPQLSNFASTLLCLIAERDKIVP